MYYRGNDKSFSTMNDDGMIGFIRQQFLDRLPNPSDW